MAKFLFIVVPALGHINPTLAVAAELKKRGHTVGYATGTDMQYSIEKEGVHFFPAGPPGIKTGLNERGHTVGHATGTDMQYSIEKEGVHFSPAGPPGVKTGLNETAKKVFKYRGLIGQYYFFKLIMESTPQTIEALQAVLQQYQPDVLVVDSITLAGGVIADISKLPWATCSSLPGMIPTRD
ncbi:MAG: hypothetical protein NTZ51_09810, partial [Proteobacteria bacterium]|nr:hypothetical protein [Pseudomonadota bacterium]